MTLVVFVSPAKSPAIISSSGFACAPPRMVFRLSEYALMKSTSSWRSDVGRFPNSKIVYRILTHDESHADNRGIENPYRANGLSISVDNLPSLGLLQKCGTQSKETRISNRITGRRWSVRTLSASAVGEVSKPLRSGILLIFLLRMLV